MEAGPAAAVASGGRDDAGAAANAGSQSRALKIRRDPLGILSPIID